jgi:hypothetical protein
MAWRGPFMDALWRYLATEEFHKRVLEPEVSAIQQKHPPTSVLMCNIDSNCIRNAPDICSEGSQLEPQVGHLLSRLVRPDQFRDKLS